MMTKGKAYKAHVACKVSDMLLDAGYCVVTGLCFVDVGSVWVQCSQCWLQCME